MKTILVLLALLLVGKVYPQDKYDLLMDKMKIESQVITFTNKYIDKLASESDNVSLSEWETIKTRIDYSPYFIGIKAVLQNNYTLAEIDNILKENEMVSPINDTRVFIYKPKPEVTEQMYNISRAFGKILNEQIKNLIQNLN